MIRNFSYSGHFGDLLIVLSKLKAYCISKNIEKISLTRVHFNTPSPFDYSIQNIVDSLLWCEFKNFPQSVDNCKELKKINLENNFTYISPYMNGIDLENSYLSDGIELPEGINPFTLDNKCPIPIKEGYKYILLHKQSGKWGGNYKEISLNSVTETFAKYKDITFILTGIGDHLSKDINEFSSKNRVINCIDKFQDIKDWMSLVNYVDLVISPEGFPAFYSMCLLKPTVFLYTVPNIFRRASITWLKNSFSIYSKEITLFEKFNYKLRKLFSLKPRNINLNKNKALNDFIYKSLYS